LAINIQNFIIHIKLYIIFTAALCTCF